MNNKAKQILNIVICMAFIVAHIISAIKIQGYFRLFPLFCAGFLVILFICNSRLKKRIKKSQDALNLLNNVYYALYKVNFEKDTYEIVKGSDYVENQLEKTGKYSVFVKAILGIIDEEARSEFEASFSIENIRVLAENKINNFGGDFKRKFNDKERWVNVSVLYDEEIFEDEVILAFRDIERDKHRTLGEIRLLEEAVESAKHSEKVKQDFFKNMSHDMRTPLNGIIGLSNLALANINDSQKVSGYLKSIEESGQSLLKLFNEILDVSRIQDGIVHLNYKPIDIVECIKDCTKNFSQKAEQECKKLKVSFDLKDKNILGDKLRLEQIVNNLLSNALKFTNSGDVIKLNLSQVERENFSQYVIEVTDTGIGMSEEFLHKIFTPYTREKRFCANQVDGSGLGLSITKNIITQMSGTITVESKLQVGTAFKVTLPFNVVRENENKKNKLEPVSLSGKHFLLVEDSVINMEVTAETLKMYGAEITEAWNGKEAVEIYQNAKPDTFNAILMDLQMPVMDGITSARKIRSLDVPGSDTIPIIAVTANSFPEDIAECMDAGMNAHISKPVDIDVLCRTLSEYT